jgi:class 3 adenylate cyclase
VDDAERIALLRSTELFRDAPPDVLRALAAACDVVQMAQAAVVFEKGSGDDAMYLVADGELELYIGDAMLDRFMPGTCFGEMALLTEQPRTGSVRAASPARLLRLSRGVFRDVLARHPAMAFGVIRDLATKIRSSIDVRLRQHETLRLVRDAFERSVSKAVMDEILATGEPVALMDGKETRATVAFADIRGFTSIAEGLSPRATIQYLNAYLGALADAVFDAGGTVDKFIGDAVMAYFGAPLSGPDDALAATRCALAMPEKLREIDRGQGRPAGARGAPQIGVGIATGVVVAGCVGNARRMEYTVMGDTVNLASRIEGLTKVYGCRVLMCGDTARAVASSLQVRLVDVVRVKGKSASTELYDVVAADAGTSGAASLREGYSTAFARYRAGDFAGAARDFSALGKDFEHDGPTRTLASRCAEFMASAPHDWEGIYTLADK